MMLLRFFGAFVLILCQLPMTTSLEAVVYGSDTVVSLQPAVTFPAADSDNEMRGFGWFKNGFTLQNQSTNCLFNSVFPVSGTVDLNGGTLYLAQDLFFNNTTLLAGFGSVIAQQGYKEVEFCSTITYMPHDAKRLDNITLFLDTDFVLNTTLHVKNNCVIDGRGNTLTLGSLGALVVDKNSQFQLRNIEIEGLGDYKIRCESNNSSIAFSEVKLVLDDDFTFTIGRMSYAENVSIQGAHQFAYESRMTSTIKADSTFLVSGGAKLRIGKYTTASADPLYFEDSSANLSFDNATFVVSPNGMRLTRGILDLYNMVTLDIKSTNTQTGLIWGSGVANQDVTIRFNAASLLDQVSGHLVYNDGLPTGMVSTSIESRLRRNPGTNIFVAKNITLPPFTIENTTLTVPEIQVAAGVSVINNNTRLEAPIGIFQGSVQRFSATAVLLNGNNTLSIIRGVLPRVLVVNGTGNTLLGNGNTGAPITFLAPTAALSLGLNGQMLANMTLAGGTATLTSDLRLGPGVTINGSGTMNIAALRLSIGSQPTTWSTNISWQGNGGVISLLSNTTLNGTWTLSGNCTIDGQGSSLTLGASGAIVAAAGARITLKNILIKGVKGNNIRCVNNTASIVLDEATYIFDDNVQFSQGSIEIVNDVDFSGTYTFLYDSSRTSTIDLKSTWEFSDGITLKTGKPTLAAQEPIVFQGNTATLSLNNSALAVTGAGLNFTKGLVTSQRDVVIDIAGTSTLQGLRLGNGVASGDMTFELYPGTTVRLHRGSLVYDVTMPEGIQARSKTATFIRGNNSNIFIKQNLELADMTVEVEPAAALEVIAGKVLSYDRLTSLQNNGEFEIVGSRVDNNTNLLSDNDSIFLNKGTLPGTIIIDGDNNILQGNGIFTGPIIFNDGDAQLIYELNGIAGNSISLNGGLLTLTRDLDFAKGFSVIGTGTVTMNTYKVNFGLGELTLTTTVNWIGDDATLNMRNNINLSGRWNISGTCSIKGNRNTLSLANGGEIVVGPDSLLVLRDIDVRGIMNSNIRCLDNNSAIMLDNVIWYQDGNYAFSMGALQFKNEVAFLGNGTFAYQSMLTSTILSRSDLLLDAGITFSYDTAPKDLIEFIDASSVMTLNGATLHATVTGWQIKKGRIDVVRDSFLSSEIEVIDESTIINEGITFGNDTASDDVIVNILDGTTLGLLEGLINYRNVNVSSWMMDTNTSMLYLYPNTRINLWQTLNLGLGVLILDNDTVIGVASGKELIGSIIPLGSYMIVDI